MPLLTHHKETVEGSPFWNQFSEFQKDTNRIQQLHDCLLQLGQDSQANIHRLTQLCGEIFQGMWATYNTMENGFLCSIGQWNTPSHFLSKRAAYGTICAYIIHKKPDTPTLIRNLPQTGYAETDPSIRKYGLITYIGLAVKTDSNCFGCLSVVFQHDYVPTKSDNHLLGILASAIRMVEERRLAERARLKAYNNTERIVGNLPHAVIVFDRKLQLLSINRLAAQFLGTDQFSANSYAITELLPMDIVNRIFLMAQAPTHSAEIGFWKQEREFSLKARVYRYRLFQLSDLEPETNKIGMIMWDVTQEIFFNKSLEKKDFAMPPGNRLYSLS